MLAGGALGRVVAVRTGQLRVATERFDSRVNRDGSNRCNGCGSFCFEHLGGKFPVVFLSLQIHDFHTVHYFQLDTDGADLPGKLLPE